jgi:hypothetical protein
MDVMRIRRIAARAHTVRHCCTLDNHKGARNTGAAARSAPHKPSTRGSRASTACSTDIGMSRQCESSTSDTAPSEASRAIDDPDQRASSAGSRAAT